jgi:hypothetical protein
MRPYQRNSKRAGVITQVIEYLPHTRSNSVLVGKKQARKKEKGE